MSFHCGHVISEFNGGNATIDNLRPICPSCNSSMGRTNMDIFMMRHGLGNDINPVVDTSSCYIHINGNYTYVNPEQFIDDYKNHKFRLIMCGHTFNEFFKNRKLYKFLNDDLTDHDFKYQLGLNVYPLPFNANDVNFRKGIDFYEDGNCYLSWNLYGRKMALIKIPNDANIYRDNDEFKTDKIIIEQIIDFKDVDDSFWIDIMQNDLFALEFVKGQTEDLCKSAVKRCFSVLRFVKEQTEDICKLAIQNFAFALSFVKNQTDDICKLAVQQDGLTLRFVHNQTDEICILAAEQNCHAIQYIKKPCLRKKLYEYAIQKYGDPLPPWIELFGNPIDE